MPGNSPRLVLDTSSLVSLVHGDLLEPTLTAFSVVISNHVRDELQTMSRFDDRDGRAARWILEQSARLDVRNVEQTEVDPLLTSKIHEGEASCIALAQNPDVDALITDDFEAMHQMRAYAQRHGFDLGLGAVVVHALVKRGQLSREDALQRLDQIAAPRDWIGRPIYQAYRRVLESEEIA